MRVEKAARRGVKRESVWVTGSDQDNVEAGAAAGNALPWQGPQNCPVPCDFCKESVRQRLCVCPDGSSSLQHLSQPPPASLPLSIFTQGELSKNGSSKIKPLRG